MGFNLHTFQKNRGTNNLNAKGQMETIKIIIEKTSDFYDAYSENCDGIYGAGATLEEVKANTIKAIELIKKNLPQEQWPKQIMGDYTILWQIDIVSFLEYYSKFISLAGMQRITGINQKQLSNYLNKFSKPRPQQSERIIKGLHSFAKEMLTISV